MIEKLKSKSTFPSRFLKESLSIILLKSPAIWRSAFLV